MAYAVIGGTKAGAVEMGANDHKIERALKAGVGWTHLGTIAGVAAGSPEHDRFVEARKRGQPLGARANKERAKERAAAIIRLAREAWQRHSELKGNLSETAGLIETEKDHALKMGAHSYLGREAIRKHLRKLRKEGLL